jgi:ABC-2 type transport system permease protein
METIYTIWQREIIRYWRDKTRIVSTLFQPLLFLFIFGMGLQRTIAGANLGVDFVTFMYPGIIAMSVMGTAFFSTISTVWDREFGFLKEILVAPVSRTSIAIGKTLGASTIASLQALILLLIAPFLKIQIELVVVVKLFLFMLLLSFAIACMGLLIASLMKTTESFGILMQVLIFPMFFLSGAFFPLTAVPTWMSVLSRLDPLSYGVDAMRQILLASQLPQEAIRHLAIYSVHANAMYLGAFSVVMIFAAVLAFNRS